MYNIEYVKEVEDQNTDFGSVSLMLCIFWLYLLSPMAGGL